MARKCFGFQIPDLRCFGVAIEADLLDQFNQWRARRGYTHRSELQHQHHKSIRSSMHVHLNHDHCLEVIVLRGKSKDVRNTADWVISTNGVKHGHLVAAVTKAGES